MSSYELNVLFTESDVQKINLNKQKLTLVKTLSSGSQSALAWLSISPFEKNQITWSNTFGLYVSNTKVEAGAKIFKISAQNPASDQHCYPFRNGIFIEPRKLEEPFRNKYQIKNETAQDLTFGLTQGIVFNGNKFDANPLNAVTVFENETATFSAIEKVKVYLSTCEDNGVVISEINSEAIELDFTDPRNSSKCISYAHGNFIEKKCANA